ncbi:hypothetical protein [[Flexibacter] sp. ATCC 35208]|uniref:hypothetical protein n=1 Tax=[Flexibacter] sp. ATCC 35208 TaxID=1936242 RepID=UPI0009CD080D|nr:hypothetical protein [[Flexibacter] sp. ATCC 35208]OMP75640.1 hypothetical protein BW716_29330 [[Flexibacter] sp. ATCC 35208]
MKKIWTIFVITLPFIGSCQNKEKLNVTAKYISLFLRDTSGKAFWRPIRETPAGDFKCYENENGDLIATFNKSDPPSRFINETKSHLEELAKIPKEICGYKFKGVYYIETHPAALSHVFYYDEKRPNDLVFVRYLVIGQNLLSVNFYSDKQDNPLKEANIQF